jgi:hypothetical protein
MIIPYLSNSLYDTARLGPFFRNTEGVMNIPPVSLRPALDRSALPVRPRRARCLVRPNC